MIAAATLLALLLTAVWMGGGRHVTFLVPAAVLAALVFWIPRQRAPDATQMSKVGRSGRWAFVLVAAFVVVQAINASHRYLPDGDGLEPRAHLAWLPHSVDADATWAFLPYLVLLGLAFGLASQRLTARGQALLLMALAAHGLVLAVAGMLGRPLQTHTHTPMGPFANSNNFAAHVNLLVLPTLALAMDARGDARKSGAPAACLLFFAAACMVAAVALSESRAGLALIAVQLLAWVVVEWRARRSTGRARGPAWLLVPVALAIGLTAILADDAIRKQVADSQGSRGAVALRMRLDAARGTLAMAGDNPVFGVGAGAFARAFPYYQPETLAGFFRYAHNDWLQAAAEFGVAGCSLLVLVVGAALAPIWHRRADLARDRVCRAMLLSMAGLALHAIVDFPLQIPAIGMLVAVWMGVCGRRLEQLRSGTGVTEPINC